MSYTILSRLKTSDITNIIGEFNQSIRVFDEKRYKEARKNGSLRYYDTLRRICDYEKDYKEGIRNRRRRIIRKRPITLLKRIKWWYRQGKIVDGHYLIIPPFYNNGWVSKRVFLKYQRLV